MAQVAWTADQSLGELNRLTLPGVLGFYAAFEITVVFAIADVDHAVSNVFTSIVAVETVDSSSSVIEYLSSKPVRLKSLDGWKFGAQRYTRTLTDLVPALRALAAGEWKLSGHTMKTGSTIPRPPLFVHPDSSEIVPLNAVLKNNFWNGSYVLEWVDSGKVVFKPFFDSPLLLQELSSTVNQWVPLGLASLSDRLGNIVVQLPVTVAMTRFRKSQNNDGMIAEIAWHPRTTPRPLRATCQMEFDKAITGYASMSVTAPHTLLPMADSSGAHAAAVWDDSNGVMLAATGPLHFIRTVAFKMRPMDPEPRVVTYAQDDGSTKTVRTKLQTKGIDGHAGAPPGNPVEAWTHKRWYKDDVARLMAKRSFIQYRPSSGDKQVVHEKALADVRSLINVHGELGAWLWDPYLSAKDILETLMHCMYSGSDLRALTDGLLPPWARVQGSGSVQNFISKQQQVFSGVASNWRGLSIEYRINHGNAGWAFHDRFLIFPQRETAALAWSLGTSINTLGEAHHILQQADNGQLIMDAFLELWKALDQPEHLIWKKP